MIKSDRIKDFSFMILAAGYGMRMRPLTERYPKVLIPLLNVPLIEYHLYLLSKSGIREIVMNVHHLREKFEEVITIGERYGIKINFSFENELLGTGGGLKNASFYIKTPMLFLLNGDTVMDVNYDHIANYHISKGGIATLLIRKREKGYSGVVIDGELRIRQLAASSPDADYMYAGLQVLSSRIFDFIEDGKPSCIVRDTLIPIILSGEEVYGYLHETLWFEIGNIHEYHRASMEMLKNDLFLDLRKGLEMEEGVWVGENTTYRKGVRIIPPVVIGENVSIGENVTLGPFVVIGNNCHIGRDTHISRSIMLPSSNLPDRTSVEDSVVYMEKIILLKRGKEGC